MRKERPPKKKGTVNLKILFVTLALVVFGLVMIYDVSFYSSQLSDTSDAAAMLKSQMIGASAGIAAMFLFAMIDYHVWKRWAGLAILVSIGLLILVLTPLGVDKNGAQRWFYIFGISVQPAEIAKVAVVLYLAAMMENKADRLNSFLYGILPQILPCGIICALIFIQPNMSTMLAIGILMMIMLFVGGARARDLLGLTGTAVSAVGLIVWIDFLKENYRFRRYLAFIDPFASPKDDGYQLVQSLYALGAGGLFGTGFGMSRQKYLYLPYGETDFIFAIIGEEFGWVGCVLLISAFMVLIWQGIKVAMTAPDIFGSMLAAGITALIGVQTLIHIAVVSASMPPTGLPLPFISYGSSSLVIFMAAVGILLNISKQAKSV